MVRRDSKEYKSERSSHSGASLTGVMAGDFFPLPDISSWKNDVLVFLHAAFPGDLDGVHGPGGQEGPGLVDGGVLVGRRRIDRPPVGGHGENFEMDLAA